MRRLPELRLHGGSVVIHWVPVLGFDIRFGQNRSSLAFIEHLAALSALMIGENWRQQQRRNGRRREISRGQDARMRRLLGTCAIAPETGLPLLGEAVALVLT